MILQQRRFAVKTILSLTVNGVERDDVVPDNLLLVDYLRDKIGLTGTKIGCDGGECGACTVLIDGRPRHACLTLATTCKGATVETVDGLSRDSRLTALQRGFNEKLGAQCGFCTPGMIMASEALLRRNPDPSENDIRDALAANICRCTGYVKIIEAVQYAAKALAEQELVA
jgi:4-hydroxybenzoyl-CoA reductase subunit gamma